MGAVDGAEISVALSEECLSVKEKYRLPGGKGIFIRFPDYRAAGYVELLVALPRHTHEEDRNIGTQLAVALIELLVSRGKHLLRVGIVVVIVYEKRGVNAGEKVGKAVAFLINTFNPETVIVGGNMAAAGDYIMLPLKSATNKYSLNLVYKDTKFRVSKMTENANAWGVAMLIRNKIIGI